MRCECLAATRALPRRQASLTQIVMLCARARVGCLSLPVLARRLGGDHRRGQRRYALTEDQIDELGMRTLEKRKFKFAVKNRDQITM